MESPSQNQTGSYARYRLLSSLGGKIADALGVVIAIRTLSAADYGVIGTALGLMAVIGFVNLTPEDILWRDLPKLRDRLSEHLSAYVWFWFVKFVVVAVVAAIFCTLYGVTHHSRNVALSAFAITMLLQLLSLSTLVEVPLFAGLQQQRGAAFVLGVRVLWLALLAANFWMRSLAYYLVALAAYAGITAALSAWLLRQRLGVSFRFNAAAAWRNVRAAALDFTLWLHLAGRARVFLMRGDLAILGGLGISLAMLGQYTVAVNLVGFSLILPGVIENVAAVSFAHHPEQRARNLKRFVALVVGLSLVQLVGGLLLGREVLRALRVPEVEGTLIVFALLLTGATGFCATSPYLAYAMCFRRMRTFFTRVFLAASVVFAVVVWASAMRWGVIGAAIAHAAVVWATGLAVVAYVAWTKDELPAATVETAQAESAFQE
jgi:O-antigen/teichoic acid export membrane protein